MSSYCTERSEFVTTTLQSEIMKNRLMSCQRIKQTVDCKKVLNTPFYKVLQNIFDNICRIPIVSSHFHFFLVMLNVLIELTVIILRNK